MPKKFNPKKTGNYFLSTVKEKMYDKGISWNKFYGSLTYNSSKAWDMLNFAEYPTAGFVRDIVKTLGGTEYEWLTVIKEAGGKEPIDYKATEIPSGKEAAPNNEFNLEFIKACKEAGITAYEFVQDSSYSYSSLSRMLHRCFNYKSIYPSKTLCEELSDKFSPQRDYDFWRKLSVKVFNVDPESVKENKHGYNRSKPKATEEESAFMYFLMSDGSVLPISKNQFIIGIIGDKSHVMCKAPNSNAFIDKGEYVRMSTNKVGVGLYDGKALIRISTSKTLFAVIRTESRAFIVDSGNGEMSVPMNEVCAVYDCETLRPIE